MSVHGFITNRLSKFSTAVFIFCSIHTNLSFGITAPELELYSRAQKILDQRCVVCHACTESPCQLNLTNPDYIRRGISKGSVLETRFLSTAKTWSDTQKGFTSVLPASPKESSVFLMSLLEGFKNQNRFPLSQAREHLKKEILICPNNPKDYAEFAKNHEFVGMPLGLPTLTQQEFQTLKEWLDQGAHIPTWQDLAEKELPADLSMIKSWEQFLNQSDARRKLMSRYFYEHTTYSHLVFTESPAESYQLVRATNESGYPVQVLKLEQPNTDPENQKYFYRFRKITETHLRKTHLVWNLSLSDQNELLKMFFAQNWSLPKHYRETYSGNPFVDFEVLPAKARAQFLVRHSKELIDQMVRGPVCVGAKATFAIRDHFWVMFMNPDFDPSVLTPRLQPDPHAIETPIAMDSSKIRDYQERWMLTQRQLFPKGLGLDQINTQGPGAQLTIFRHQHNSSVHHGWIGQGEPTVWLLSYSNFERLYYNLVVNFRPWASMFHLLETWTTMKSIREEGEETFLMMLPESSRQALRNHWNDSKSRKHLRHFDMGLSNYPSQLSEYSTDPQLALLNSIKEISLEAFKDPRPYVNLVRSMKHPPELPAAHLPELSLLIFHHDGKIVRVSSLIRNRWYKNHISPLIDEASVHDPSRDTASLLEGVSGSHPSMYFFIEVSKQDEFFDDLKKVTSDSSRTLFLNKWGLRRNAPDFWQKSDLLQNWMKSNLDHDGGLMDLSQYDLID